MGKDSSQKPSRDTARLRERIDEIKRDAGAEAIAVAVRDVETSVEFDFESDRWFHAASTIKVPILVGVFGAVHGGELLPQSRLHVRNRFRSAADGSIFRVEPDRDANAAVHAALGKTMQVRELAFHMIATSSNLATNLLLDYVGLESMQHTFDELGLDEGIELHRGVEDHRAFDGGLSNRVTAAGLARMLLLIAEERAFSRALSREMLDILHAQEFNSGIPAPLPKRTRVAHKTGEISTIAHDAGVVYLHGRNPYVLVVLTEWDTGTSGRQQAVARVSEAVYGFLTSDASSRMGDDRSFPLQVVDGMALDRKYREALRPGEPMLDAAGRERLLPRYFYEIPSWDVARKLELSPHFYLWEFIQTDVRETDVFIRRFPRYVPCAITLLALCLERFREAVGTFVHISANGGYRSPAHRLTRDASPHCWGTAANIYRIGSTYLDDEKSIERYSMVARETLPAVWTRPTGEAAGFADDHLHLDFGYVVSMPRDVPGEADKTRR